MDGLLTSLSAADSIFACNETMLDRRSAPRLANFFESSAKDSFDVDCEFRV